MGANICHRDDLHSNLVRKLKCKICYELIKLPVTICKYGHAVCLNCGKRRRCELCDEEISSTPGRHTLLNQIISVVTNQTDFLKNLHEVLKCPICYEQLTNRCTLCINGHGVCRMCYLQTSTCPMCRASYHLGHNRLVNIILQELNIKLECENHIKGCDESFTYSQLLCHEKTCKYKEFNCIVRDCHWCGKANEIRQHCKEVHEEIITKQNLKLVRGQGQILMLERNDNTYWIQYNFSSEKITLTCQQHEPKNCGWNLFMTITTKDGKNKTYKCKILDLADDTTGIINTIDRILIPKEIVETLGDHVDCRLVIHKNDKIRGLFTSDVFSWLFLANLLIFGYLKTIRDN